jgi:DNA repair protein RadC
LADHSGHRKRVKTEFMTRGLEGWPDHRVLELLLFYALPQGDVNGLAHDLMDRFGSLAGVLDASADELCKVKGVSEHTAALLKLVPALSGRYLSSRTEVRSVVHCTDDAYSVLAPYFYGAKNEMAYVLCLDGKNQILGVRKLSEGCIDATQVTSRRVAEEAMALRAAKVYLAHNHISNIALPSQDDLNSTMVIRTALYGVGVELVDHLVFVDGDMVSMKESQRQFELL